MNRDNTYIGQNRKQKQSPTQKARLFFKSDKFVKLFTGAMGGLLISMIIVALTQFKHLNTQYSFEQFFPEKHILLTESAKIRQTFRLQERSAFLITIEKPQNSSSSWLEAAEINKLGELSQDVASLPEASEVISLANLQGAIQSENEFSVGPIYATLPEKEWRTYTQSHPLIYKQIISEDFKSTLMLVEPKDLAPHQLETFSAHLEKLVQERFPESEIALGGSPAIQAQFTKSLFDELKVSLTLSILVFGLVLAMIFRGFSTLILTFSCLVLANVVVMGVLAYFSIPFSVLLSTLPIIVSIALISVMIHSLHRWAEVLQVTPEPLSLRHRFSLSLGVIKEMAMANFMGSITTGMGFLALCVADIPLIRQYGWVIAMAVMIAWFLTQALLLGFMFLTSPALRSWAQAKSYWTLPILKYGGVYFVAILIGSIAFAFMGNSISFSGRLFDDLPQNQSARIATERIDKQFGGVNPYEVILTSQNENFWKNPQTLKNLQQNINHLRQWSSFGSVHSVTDFFNNKIPDNKAAIAETFFLFSMAEKDPLRQYITQDGKSLRIAFRFHDLPSHQIEQTRRNVKHLLHKNFSDVKVEESGLAVISHSINQEVAKELVFGFWHSLVIIGLLLMFIFKSLRWALVACLPNLIPPAVLLGVLAITDTPIKPGVALIFSVALGLAFNNTVYVLSRLKNMMKSKEQQFLPIKQALLQEGNPCLFESLIMFFGFAIFLLSEFKANQIFGTYMLISILAAVLGDLIFMPTLLKIFPRLLLNPQPKRSTMPLTQSPSFARISASVLVAVSIGFFAAPLSNAAKGDEAENILRQVQKQVESKDEQALINMKIIESDGEIKSRTLRLRALRDDKYRIIAKVESPADIKNTGFLAEISADEESQWLYLPSNKQVRRVVGSSKSSGVLGSELTAEDLNSTALRGSQLSLVKKDANNAVLSVVPKKGTSVYDKVLLTISTQQMVPIKTEYFQKGQVKKTISFLNYKKVGNGLWRAQLIQVRNLANNRGTDVELSDLKVNSGLKTSDFSVNALKRH